MTRLVAWAYRIWLLIVARPPDAETPVARVKVTKEYLSKQPSFGTWKFRRDILERLEEHQQVAGLLRQCDPDAYKLYSRIGAVVGDLSDADETKGKVLVCSSRAGLYVDQIPSMGAVAWQWSGCDKDTLGLKLTYFTRLRAVTPKVEWWSAGDIYSLIAVWGGVTKGKEDKGAIEFHVIVEPDGSCRLLRELAMQHNRLPRKSRRKGGAGHCPEHSGHTVVTAGWKYPSDLKLWWGERERPGWAKTIEEFAAAIFWLTIHTYRNSQAGLRVQATRNGLSAAFSIEILRTPYFFKDRDLVLNEHGHRRRIFHIVRTHERHTKTATTYVKSHFRGDRRFTWNGFDVIVSMPGLHHQDMLDFDVEGYDSEAATHVPDKDLMSRKTLGKTLSRHLTG